MTKEQISILRRITPWPTLLLLIGSATYSAFISTNLWVYAAALVGAIVGAFDRHLGTELSKLEKEDKEKAEKRLRDLEEQRKREWDNAQPREFPKEKIPDFIREARRGIDGPLTLSLSCLCTDDGEPYRLAVQICDAFGFDPKNITEIISSTKGFRNIEIGDNSTDGEPTLLAQNLIRAFEVVGLKTEYAQGSPKNKVPTITIGKKTM